jgi:hypothetical protein
MITALTRDHVYGFIGGVGLSVLGFYLYKKNKASIDDFLRSRGIQVPASGGGASQSMSLEELVREKERLEDLIAEKELACKTGAPVS